MKTYFINPPASSKISREGRCMVEGSAWGTVLPPISLASCASTVRNTGSEVMLDDCIAEDISLLDLEDRIKRFQPDLIILNTATPSIENDLKIAKLAKALNSSIKVGTIGIHPSILVDNTFSLSEDLDFIIRGEPEFTVRDLVLALRDNISLDQITGLSYRLNGKIFYNKSREFINDLDLLPFPAWDLVDISKYKITFTKNPYLLIIPSRGCPYNCIFCNSKVYYGQRLRLRSPQKIVDEMEWIQKKFKVNDILFWAESFTVNKEFVINICNEIMKRGLHIRWISNSRVDNVDWEILNMMKSAGCWMVGFGVESGNQVVLNNSRKQIRLSQSRDAVYLARKVGLQVSIHSIIGLPGETRKTALETINFVKQLDADFAQFYCAVPFPGSDLFNLAKQNKWLDNCKWSDFNQSHSVLTTNELDSKTVERLRRRAYLNYYLRPKLFWKIGRQTKSLSSLGQLFLTAIRFWKWI